MHTLPVKFIMIIECKAFVKSFSKLLNTSCICTYYTLFNSSFCFCVILSSVLSLPISYWPVYMTIISHHSLKNPKMDENVRRTIMITNCNNSWNETLNRYVSTIFMNIWPYMHINSRSLCIKTIVWSKRNRACLLISTAVHVLIIHLRNYMLRSAQAAV